MDAIGDESWDDERDDTVSGAGAGVFSLDWERHQSRDFVLGDSAGDDDKHIVNDLIDIYDHQHILHNNNVNNGTVHHHHGPGDNDILVHQHELDNPGHDHILYTNDYDHYGPSDHHHDTADAT